MAGRCPSNYLSKHKEKTVIHEITEKNYLNQNNLILMFVLHHTADKDLIENIILQSMCTLDHLNSAHLETDETRLILDIIKKLPNEILSEKPAEEERKKVREHQDKIEKNSKKENDEDRYDGSDQEINDIYKILKNNELFGQILRNHYGNLDKSIIKDILNETISSGLRLIKLMLNEEELKNIVEMVHSRHPDAGIEKINRFFQFICFLWTMNNLERITHVISIRGLRPLVKDIAKENSSPAHDIISYFSMLDTIEKFTYSTKKELDDLIDKHKDNLFVRKVISLRTQFYLNTHDVDYDIKQSVCDKIGVSYKSIKKNKNNVPKIRAIA